MSRADIARVTGLTKVTVSKLVGELLDRELVIELGVDVRPDTPGKRPIMVALNDANCAALGEFSSVKPAPTACCQCWWATGSAPAW